MKHKNKQLLKKPVGHHTDINFTDIEFSDEFDLFWFVDGKRKKLVSVNSVEQNELLINGKPCVHTDKRYVSPAWFMKFYDHNNILFRRKPTTLGKVIKRISKIEHLFPVGTNIKINNKCYGFEEIDGKEKTFGLTETFVTKRKFFGFAKDFTKNEPFLTNEFKSDTLMNVLIRKLRETGFNLYVYNNNPDRLIGEHDGQVAIGYGNKLRIGFSEHNNSFRGYSAGEENILVDLDENFDKWSRCNCVKKPKSIEEIDNCINMILNVADIED